MAKFFRNGIALVALIAGLWSCSQAPAPEATEAPEPVQPLDSITQRKADAIDSLLHWSNRRGMFNGQALVAVKGRIITQKALGFSNFRTRDSLTLQSNFQLASVSKIFTATAVMLLEQQGKLSYDQKVQELLPDFQYDTITVRHLLNHRSGLPRYMSLADKYTDRLTPINNWQMLDLFCQPRPQLYFLPGNGFNYLNTNYALLANIVEATSGMPFDQFMKEQVFDPLGMTGTTVFNAVDSTLVPNETAGHKGNRRRPIRGVDYYINGVVGDKGVYSNVEDLYRFDRALYSGDFLTEATLNEAFTPGSPKVRRDNRYYGFGWRITTYKGNPLVYHNGWWMGYKSSFIRFIDDETTIILLTNTDRQLEVLPKIKQILYPEGTEAVPEEAF